MFVLPFFMYLLIFSGCLSTERLEEAQSLQPPAPLPEATQPVQLPRSAQPAPPAQTAQPSLPSPAALRAPEERTSPPPEVLFNFCAGYHALLDGHWNKAVQYFEKALEKDPRSERLLKYLVGCYIQMGKKEKSLEYIQRLSEISPDDFRVHYTLGDIYQREERTDDAIAAFERATRSNLSNVEPGLLADALYRLASLYLQKNEPTKAISCLKSIFQLNAPVDYSLLYSELGIAYAEAKDFLNAKENLQKAKDLNPSLGQARMYLAMVYEETGELQEAIKESEAFLVLFPESWIGYAYVAGLYKKASRPEEAEFARGEAINILTRKVVKGSQDPREYLALAQLLIVQERRDDAMKVLNNAINTIKEDKSEEVHLLLANLYYENNCDEAVEKELKAILRIDPNAHEASNFLGYFYAERGKELDEALELVEKALQAQPNNGAYIDSLGWVYYKQATERQGDTRLEQALQKLMEASQDSPEPEIFKHLGEIYYSMGQWEAANSQWQKALQKPPQSPKDEQIILWIQEKLKKLDSLKKLEEEPQVEQPGL